MAYLTYFPEERIALAKEIREHPPLQILLAGTKMKARDFPAMLAEIATYCNILVNGDYMPEELDKICGVLVEELRKMRSIIVTAPGAGTIQ